jgi:hypothetical protein
MNGKKAKQLRKLARDEFMNRVAAAKPDAEGQRRGLLQGLVHNPRNERSAIQHPESLRGIQLIAKRVFRDASKRGIH